MKTIWYIPDTTIAWLCNGVTYNIEAMYNFVQQKFKSARLAQSGAR